MARQDVPPFARGETFFNGTTKDPTLTDPDNICGRRYIFEPSSPGITYDSSRPVDPTGRQTEVLVCKNTSSIALKPGRIVRFDPANATINYGGSVDGYCNVLADRPAGVVDEFLPAVGVAVGDYFFLVVKGPGKVVQPASGQSTFAIGDVIVPNASGSTRVDDLAGRVLKQDLTGATATLGNNLQNVVGYAAAANGTANALVAAMINIR